MSCISALIRSLRTSRSIYTESVESARLRHSVFPAKQDGSYTTKDGEKMRGAPNLPCLS